MPLEVGRLWLVWRSRSPRWRLAAWQRVVLGMAEAPFRTTSAFAKAFDACLAQADDPDLPLPARSARVHLDVAFFHPFADGNARAAALALYFVLACEGVVLEQAAPLLTTVRPAGDVRAAETMARHVTALAEQTRRHAELAGQPAGWRSMASERRT